jgi:formylmethanofuran dehydrogenase subunit C
VSGRLTIRRRGSTEAVLDVEGFTADRLAALSASEAARLPVWQGRRRAELGDFFDVREDRLQAAQSASGGGAVVVVEGDLTAVSGLGAGMGGGELIIDGDAGARVGAGMTGGSITVRGSVGDDAAMAMAGGLLCVEGNAGARLAAASPGAARGMSGGEVIVHGSAGAEVAARARRGLVVVGRNTGPEPGRAMIAGTLVVFGAVGAPAGIGNKRGSIVAGGPIEVPPTYRYACTYFPPYVRLLMTYLSRAYGLGQAHAALGSAFRRYCGDVGIPGRGEILERVPNG